MSCWIIQPLACKQLSRDPSASNDVKATIEEPAFFEVVEDASDIPVDVVKRHVASGSVDDGFLVTEDGGLLRTSAAEDVDVSANVELFPGYDPSAFNIPTAWRLINLRGSPSRLKIELIALSLKFREGRNYRGSWSLSPTETTSPSNMQSSDASTADNTQTTIVAMVGVDQDNSSDD
ncbi:hypothetical protein BYT27DRAFT_7261525 [Phlegmacium glaucopus]|nr:hypothetical protein BYT27DRAFT_7261525 [Phlegmacium glaucopus]